jgi:hypothetical protein
LDSFPSGGQSVAVPLLKGHREAAVPSVVGVSIVRSHHLAPFTKGRTKIIHFLMRGCPENRIMTHSPQPLTKIEQKEFSPSFGTGTTGN